MKPSNRRKLAPAFRVHAVRLCRSVAIAIAIVASGCAHPTRVETNTPAKGTSAKGTAKAPSLSLAQRYTGTYLYAGTDAERAAVNTAVDSATDGMGIATGFARSALMKRSEIRGTYTISFDGKGNVSVESPGYPPETSPTNGTEVKLTNKYGDESENSQHFDGGALLQQGRTDDGSGSTRFKMQPDGKTLIVTRVMKSPKLPGPVEFSLTYVRHHGTP
jgi:hypothetical protein